MKENKKKKRIAIGAVILSIIIALGIVIYFNFNSILMLVSPSVYARKAVVSTGQDIGDVVWPMFEDKANLKMTLTTKEITYNDKTYKVLKGTSVSILFKENKEKGTYSIDASAGVAAYRPYKLSVYTDKEKLVLYCPKIREESILLSWSRVSEILNTDKNLYEYTNGNISKGIKDIENIARHSKFILKDRKEKKYEVIIDYKDNPFSFDRCYIYINDDNKLYRITTDDIDISLNGEENICNNISYCVNIDGLGEASGYMKSDIEKSKEKILFDIDEFVIDYKKDNDQVHAVFSGSCNSLIMDIKEPDYDKTNVVEY